MTSSRGLGYARCAPFTRSNGALPVLVRGFLRGEGAGCADFLANRSLFKDDELEGPKILSVSDGITPLAAARPNGSDIDMDGI